MITLGELCDLVGGPHRAGDRDEEPVRRRPRLAARTADVLAGYRGPAAVMSFDPAQVAALREIAPALPRGIVAERRYRHREWDRLPAASKRAMAYFKHVLRTRRNSSPIR